MKLLTIMVCWLLIIPRTIYAQDVKHYSDFPITISVNFHAFALPFRDLKANFSNIGIGLGTEVALNSSATWVQQIGVVWYHNKALGNGLLFSTQNVWRPTFGSNGYGEVKGGVGYLQSFLPTTGFRQVNGTWKETGRKGKGMFCVPLGIGAGYDIRQSQSLISPFINYQFLAVTGYNTSIPVVPNTLIQIGSRIH
ncbi:MAG: hypothetical protein HYZ44_16960 [Bacteroidetes bacterium]|nr:hypothetical protein [Bacteroidota bacterium]